jgi:hypothetical protein
MVTVPCRSRFPVFGSVTVEYEAAPRELPAVVSLNPMMPVGAIVGLAPRTVATKLVLDPAFTGLGETWRITAGAGNCANSVPLLKDAGW